MKNILDDLVQLLWTLEPYLLAINLVLYVIIIVKYRKSDKIEFSKNNNKIIKTAVLFSLGLFVIHALSIYYLFATWEGFDMDNMSLILDKGVL